MTTVEAVRRLGKKDREILEYRLGLKGDSNWNHSRSAVSKICRVGELRIKLAEAKLLRSMRGPRREAVSNLLSRTC